MKIPIMPMFNIKKTENIKGVIEQNVKKIEKVTKLFEQVKDELEEEEE